MTKKHLDTKKLHFEGRYYRSRAQLAQWISAETISDSDGVGVIATPTYFKTDWYFTFQPTTPSWAFLILRNLKIAGGLFLSSIRISVIIRRCDMWKKLLFHQNYENLFIHKNSPFTAFFTNFYRVLYSINYTENEIASGTGWSRFIQKCLLR